jgi:hypothetical protein
MDEDLGTEFRGLFARPLGESGFRCQTGMPALALALQGPRR